MGYLNKKQYEYRRESAARRAAENESKAISSGMTEDQAELISELCSLRHEFHCNIDKIVYNDNENTLRAFIELNSRIKESGLDTMDFIPCDVDDYIDIDTINERLEYEQVPEDDDERQEWYDNTYEEIHEQLCGLHNKIEAYLGEIDKKYRTNFCPTGSLRTF